MARRCAGARVLRSALLAAGLFGLSGGPAFMWPVTTAAGPVAVTSRPAQRQLAARAPRPALAVVSMVEMKKPEKLGGKLSEAFLTAFSTAVGVYVCSRAALYFGQPLWVPPFGAVALGFAAEATAAAKAGKVLDVKDFGPRNIKNIASTFFGAIVCIGVAHFLGAQPEGRAVAIAAVAFFISLLPLCSFWPSAGGLAGLYMNELLNHGALALPGFWALKFAVLPCAAGCLLMLVSTRIATAFMATLMRFRFRLGVMRPEPEKAMA